MLCKRFVILVHLNGEDMSFSTFQVIQLYKDVKRSNMLCKRFVILVHLNGEDMSFLTFQVIQL